MVKFSVMQEFCDKLMKDVPHIERKIIRLTALFKASSTHPRIRHVSVIATYKVASEVIRYEECVGDVLGNEEQDRKVEECAESLLNELHKFCQDAPLDVRAGIYEY